MPELKDKPFTHYQMNEPSEPIEIHKGRIVLNLEHVASNVETKKDPNETSKTTNTPERKIISEDGILTLKWYPTPAIRFEMSYKKVPGLAVPLYKKCTLNIPDLDLNEEGLAHGPIRLDELTGDSSEHLHVMQKGLLLKKCIEIGTSSDRLIEVKFHIVNFRRGICKYKGEDLGKVDILKDHLKLDWIDLEWNIKVDNWNIIVRPADNCDELIEGMDTIGGFAITHTGVLKRQDSNGFSAEQAEKVMDALYYLFSLIRGRWVGIILPRGASKSMLVWEKWDLTKQISSWGHINNWAAPLSVVIDDKFIQNFVHNWTKSGWRHDIRPILNWYIGACLQDGGLEGAIAMTQFGLERLTWMELRNMDFIELLGRKDYDGISAANKLRWFLKSKKIPLDVKELANISKYADERSIKPVDGPQVFTYLRNNIAHPEKDDTTIPSIKVLAEAYSIGLWYLEMSILHHLGYNGKYLDRRYLTEAQVPWLINE